ncbi:MAG: glycosyltransferase, partial [Ignavibacteria bacterium]
MKRIYFHLPHYPNWFDGANKYQTIVFNYFSKKKEQVYVFGRSVDVKHSKYWSIQMLFKLTHIIRILIGIIHIVRIPKRSILILNNASFFHYIIPLALNKYWKKHTYVLIVHDLVQRDRPAYLRTEFENFFIKNSHKLISVSKTTKDDLSRLKLASNNIPVVYPGLDVDLT